MRIAYFDCPTGIAGNMILGALIDAGLNLNYLKKELNHLRLTPYSLHLSKKRKSGIAGTYFEVEVENNDRHRDLKAILSIIKESKLSKNVKTLSSMIFKRLAEAEAKVHGIPVNYVHFHEVGAIDAIIDIVGTCIGLEKLGIERVYCSPLPCGKGTIRHAHGILPNPAPATVELLKGVPTYGTNMRKELVTPTGAAIISTLAEFGDLPRMKLEATGSGAGLFALPLPNLLRVFIGEAQIPSRKDAILQIETNIDDLDPKLYSRVIRKLMNGGALDAYIVPILMKKERKAIQLVALTVPEKRNDILETIFDQTTSLGVRTSLVSREILARKSVAVKTVYGKAKIKLGLLGQRLMTIAPEYENYKKLAKKHHIPLRAAHHAGLKAFLNKNQHRDV
jgi:uncharacterized protein (TIGR00299 family) protein